MNKVERTLRGFYKYGEPEGLGKIYTPKELRDRMIEIAKPEKTDKILVLYNIEFASDFRDYENVVFASDDKVKNEIVEEAFGMETIFVEENKKIGKNLEGMKFDLIISNPPYNQNLDLKILKEIYNIGEKICFVHPATWLYDNKNRQPLFVSLKDTIKNNFTAYEKIDNANKIFNISIFADIFITLFDKSCEKPIDMNDIDVHGDSKIYKSIKEKILTYSKNSNVHTRLNGFFNQRPDKDQNILAFTCVRGHPGSNDFYTIVGEHIKPNDRMYLDKSKYVIWINFNSEKESSNCLSYFKTKIARFALSVYKNNQRIDNGVMESVPYMPTYEHPWTDEEVAAELGLTDEELAWAINWIPDYYPEDKEKYAKYKNL